MSRLICTVFSAVAIVMFSVAASGQDLKDIAARQKIAAEKLTAQVTDAIEASRKQDPVDAKFALREMLNRVRDSQDLLPSQRAGLVQRIQGRLGVVEDAVRSNNIKQDQKPVYTEKPKYKPPVGDPSGGVSGAAKGFTDLAKSAQKTNADLIREREKGILGVNIAMEKSHVPTDKEISFPADWKERSERMKKLFGPQLTEKEVKLLKTLNSVMSVDYDNVKLKTVINTLQDKTGLTIFVDPMSLTDLNIDYEDPVSFKVDKATVRTILKKVLGDKGLTYIIKEGSIQVMTPEKAAKNTIIRTYSVADLVEGDPRLTMQFGPFIAQAQMNQNAQQLIILIQQAIEPSYWQPNGPGSIIFFPPTKSLVIRASAEMHYQLGSPGIFGGR